MNDAIEQLRTTGHEIPGGDLQRLSPLAYQHIKLLGDFPFILPHELAAGRRRPLRPPGQPA